MIVFYRYCLKEITMIKVYIIKDPKGQDTAVLLFDADKDEKTIFKMIEEYWDGPFEIIYRAKVSSMMLDTELNP